MMAAATDARLLEDALPRVFEVAAELGLDMLNANFVGDLPSDADELVLQFNLPFGRPSSYLLPCFPNFGPPQLSTTQWMHRCDE